MTVFAEAQRLAELSRGNVVDIRRQLHRIPEPGLAEHKTASMIASELRRLGLKPHCGIAKTGITARLDFGKPGPMVMLRADMDALPVREETGLDFASTHDGFMHACGHDGHMAMVLGAAGVLKSLPEKYRQELRGSVLFLFQPAEESVGGAAPMIDAGVMQGVDYCLACHIWPSIPAGCVGVRSGYLMAAMSKFDIGLTGVGGHGSQPHLGTDVINAAARITCALQQLVSRRVNPLLPAVLTVGCLHAGDSYNVIPQTARIQGSTRAFHPEVRDAWARLIRQEVEGICMGTGVSFSMDFFQRDGPVDNDPFVTETVHRAALRIAGSEKVLEPDLSLAGEDFSRFQEHAPGCMFFLGSGTPEGGPLHNPGFCFPEDILLTGTKVFCEATLSLLAFEQ